MSSPEAASPRAASPPSLQLDKPRRSGVGVSELDVDPLDRDIEGESFNDVTRRQRLYTAMSLLGDTFSKNQLVKGRYRLLHELGRGGMGAVLAAHDIEQDRPVAIKLLLPELAGGHEVVARFEREAQVLATLNSEHVCKLWDTGTLASGAPYMVMERLVGNDLATVLVDCGRLSPARAVDYVIDACHAVAAAHAAGIVHRDLKPENLFLCEREDGSYCIKVLDFGLSKWSEPDPAVRTRKLTAETQVMGTPCYMAPEQWLSSSNAGPRADQWALATILFELLTGESPFLGCSIAEICGNIVNRPTPSLRQKRPSLPLGLELILNKALEKHPRARYRNVLALAQALSAFRDTTTISNDNHALVALPARVRSKLVVVPSDLSTTVPRVPEPDDSDATTLPLGYARRLGLGRRLSAPGKGALVFAAAAAVLVTTTAALTTDPFVSATLASAGTLKSQASRAVAHADAQQRLLLPAARRTPPPNPSAQPSATQPSPAAAAPAAAAPARRPAAAARRPAAVRHQAPSRPISGRPAPLPDLGLESRQ